MSVAVVQSLTHVWLFVTLWTAARQASLSSTISRSLLKLMSNESVMPSNHLILCCPLLLLPSVFPSIRIFSSESTLCIRWPQYWSFSFSISSSNEYSRLIFFKTDWFDLLAVQGTRKSLLQHHSSKASVLQCSAFFMVQLARVCTFQILILPHCYPTGFHFSSSFQNMIPLSASFPECLWWPPFWPFLFLLPTKKASWVFPPQPFHRSHPGPQL